jgi:hypothetical protein
MLFEDLLEMHSGGAAVEAEPVSEELLARRAVQGSGPEQGEEDADGQPFRSRGTVFARGGEQETALRRKLETLARAPHADGQLR